MKARRKELGISAESVAAALGVSRATVFRYEKGDIEKVPGSFLEPLAKVLQTSAAYLMGWEDSEQSRSGHELPVPRITEEYITFPVVTTVAAHYNAISSDESLSGDTADIPLRYLRGRKSTDFCVMRVNGDSMYPDFKDGDIVLVLLQSTLDHSGQIGVVSYGTDEMTIKRVNYKEGEPWVELVPLNPALTPKKLTGVDLETCHIIGVPRLIIRELE